MAAVSHLIWGVRGDWLSLLTVRGDWLSLLTALLYNIIAHDTHCEGTQTC